MWFCHVNWLANKVWRMMLHNEFNIIDLIRYEWALTLHLHLMHFCSPCEAIIGCHSCPFLWYPMCDLQPPLAIITVGEFNVPDLLPSSFITSVFCFDSFCGLTCKWELILVKECLNIKGIFYKTYVRASLAASLFIRTISKFFIAIKWRALYSWTWYF